MTPDVEAIATLTAAERSRFFYASIVGEAEMRDALAVEDLSAEIALLRASVRSHLLKHPEDRDFMLKSVALIVRAVAGRYRMSEQRATDLGEALAKAVDFVNDQFQIGPTADE